MIHIKKKMCNNCFMKTKIISLLALSLLLGVAGCNSNNNNSNSNKNGSQNNSNNTSANPYVRDDLVDAPSSAVMNKTGFDRIVEYLNVNSETIRTLYEGKRVALNKRAQINKEGESTGAALYVQKIKIEVADIYNSYQDHIFWSYDSWNAKDAWEDDPVVIYYYKVQGFIKAKVEFTDDTFYKVEKSHFIYYDDTGVIEKEEYRWIVSSSIEGDGVSLFDCQLRVRYDYSQNTNNSSSYLW